MQRSFLATCFVRCLFATCFVVAFFAAGCTPNNDELSPLASGGAGGQGGATSVTPDSGGGPPPPAPSDWCSARTVLIKHCVDCHTPGSPFGSIALVTFADFQVKLPSGKLAYESVKERIHDQMRLMPPTNDRLTPTELATLDNWIAAGATSGGNPSCTPGVPDAGDGAGGAAGSGGAGGAAGKGGGGAGGASDGGVDVSVDGGDGSSGDSGRPDTGTDVGTDSDGGRPPTDWPTDCEQRYTVVAHGASSPTDKTKFNVSASTSRDFYQCFLFKAPWGATAVQALRFRPVIDDARVVSRWALYGLDSSNGPDGQVGAAGCRNGTLLQSWSPGATETVLPGDVGLQMPRGANAYLALEVHYDNIANHRDAMDASGVEYCVTKALRTNTASVHWLGSTNFSIPARSTGTDVVNTCDPIATQVAHLVAMQPQMNRLGTRSRLVLNRASGAKETLHDDPFAITDQRTYASQAIVRDGDTLTTTCTYKNAGATAVGFGDTVADENCYHLVTAYPVGALSGLFTPNRCMSLF